MSGYIGSKASVVSSGAERKKVFTITTTTTSLTGLAYTPTKVHVFHNGIRLVDGTDYTATNGTSITLTNAAENGDEVVVVSYASFQTSDTVSASAGGTFAAPVTIDGNSATVLTVDRATSDGVIIDVQKGGSSVGSIGNNGNEIFIGSPNSGGTYLRLGGGGFYPATSTGANSDNTTNIGDPAVRFKDLYLSGGVYLGGTGAANKLDDYETGTWTPTYDCATTSPTITYDSTERSASYIKIGKMVFIQGTIRTDAASGGSGGLLLAGLPFSSKSSGSERCGGFSVSGYQSGFGASHPTGGYINNGSTEFVIMGNSDTATATGLDASDLGSGANNNFMMFHGQYEID